MLDREPDFSTKIERPGNAYMDSVLGVSFPVLDHGMVRMIDWMGDDNAIVQAARVSYGTGTETAKSDRGLIRYLMSHWHSTPFEMVEVKLHVKLPVFVARQWIRHRTANVNEYSARYSILDREFYIPEPEQLAKQSVVNKQGRSELMTPEQSREIQEWMIRESNKAYDGYLDVMKPEENGGHYGLARELARMNLPTNIYTQWYWKTDLHNLLHFLRLRADPHAQYEIRVYAEQICNLIRPWVPHSFEAFEDYRMNAKQFSAQEMEFLRKMIPDEMKEVFWHDASALLADGREATDLLNPREAREFLTKLKG